MDIFAETQDACEVNDADEFPCVCKNGPIKMLFCWRCLCDLDVARILEEVHEEHSTDQVMEDLSMSNDLVWKRWSCIG